MGIDLHSHSVYSDGSLTPEEVINAAAAAGLSAVSITDHDNVLAYDFARNHAKKIHQEENKPLVEVISGIEINTILDTQEVHVLGYFIDSYSPEMIKLIAYQQKARIEQTIEIIKNLKKDAKINIKLEDVIEMVKEGGSVGRPHIAKAIVNTGGASTMIEAYKKYLSDNSPTYIKRKTVSPQEAVEVIYDSGGVPVLAHPCDIDKPEEIIEELMSYGLRGLEVYHRKHSPAVIEYYSSLSEKYGLIMTGGSDCHGPKTNGQLILGKTHVPDWVLVELKKEKKRIEIAAA